ncbi:DUF4760 domain-containing protein [Pseudoalteromonas sp. CNC9-20]|uniref:DUF4760 domain-containing protein n=1 Tax=Pseudoalteromonas sp. CNC9-20 TaxID=2917750 RepID=UPI001EF4CF7A|nr:DUF4760 domain-containing protein [Pseudoalteromonas sp. CNC9-20]MCG7570536.1 DUF4760 domain-containing protein [Pseudoalteromonas sp. CNC9-20]
MSVVDWVKVISSCLTSLSVISGVFIYCDSRRNERKKNALNFWYEFADSTVTEFIEVSEALPKYFSDTNLAQVKGDKELNARVHNLLNKFERLALGVNVKAYDPNTIKKIAKTDLVGCYLRLSPLIRYHRLATGKMQSWSEFEKLYNYLIEER